MKARIRELLSVILLIIGGLVISSGCISKSEVQARERAAFLAGQQQAMQQFRQQQAQGPTVTFIGAVRNNLVTWTPELTLAKAVIAADYYGSDPTEIIILRDQQPIPVDPKELLGGEDVPLQPRDVVEIK